MNNASCADAQQDGRNFRNLKETLTYHQREVQDSHAWLKQTYAALDEQAGQIGQESTDRYLLNNALLGQLFSGPGPLPEPLDGQTDVTELAVSLRERAAGNETEDAAAQPLSEQPADSAAGEKADLEGFMMLLERIRTAASEAELEACQEEYKRQRRAPRADKDESGPEQQHQESTQRKRAVTCVCPGVQRVEAFDDELSCSSREGSPVRL